MTPQFLKNISVKNEPILVIFGIPKKHHIRMYPPHL